MREQMLYASMVQFLHWIVHAGSGSNGDRHVEWRVRSRDASRSAVQVDMAHVDLHVSSDVMLHVDQLRGRVVPQQRDAPNLDDKRSYVVAVDSGRVAIDLPSLNVRMARAIKVGGGS